jgi:hypothetical protein
MHSVRALCFKNVHSLYVQNLGGGAYTWRVSSGRQRSTSDVAVLLGLTSVIWPSLFVISNSISSQATSKLLPKFLNGALKHSGPNEATMETWNTGTAKQVLLTLEGIRYVYVAHSLPYRLTFYLFLRIRIPVYSVFRFVFRRLVSEIFMSATVTKSFMFLPVLSNQISKLKYL